MDHRTASKVTDGGPVHHQCYVFLASGANTHTHTDTHMCISRVSHKRKLIAIVIAISALHKKQETLASNSCTHCFIIDLLLLSCRW
jgi:hypothetical protein